MAIYILVILLASILSDIILSFLMHTYVRENISDDELKNYTWKSSSTRIMYRGDIEKVYRDYTRANFGKPGIHYKLAVISYSITALSVLYLAVYACLRYL